MNEMGSGIKPLPSIADYPRERLFSLDLLRGLDMVLLTAIMLCWRKLRTLR